MKNKSSRYYIIYEREGKKGYIASAPAIPGCVVYGKTLEEAHRNINIAILECFGVLFEFRRKIPKETIKPEFVKRFSFVKVPDYVKTETSRI